MLIDQVFERAGEQCHSLGAVARAFLGRRLFDEGARSGLGNEVGHIDRVIVDAEHERGVLFEERGDVGAGPGQAVGAGQIAVVFEVDPSTVQAVHRGFAGELNVGLFDWISAQYAMKSSLGLRFAGGIEGLSSKYPSHMAHVG